MTKHALLAFATLALAACGQATTVESAPEAPIDIVQSSGGACTEVPALIDNVGFESQGLVSGYTIMSDPGTVACSESALGSVECAVTGPAAIRVEQSATAFTNYTLDAGQSGTLTVGPTGPACYLNANGG
jgi:hypothetical protein